MYLNIIKAIYDTPIAKIILNREKQTISPKVRTKTRVPTLSIPIQHSHRIPSKSNKIVRRNKRNKNRKGRSETNSICRQHDLIPKRLEKLQEKNSYIL
jgi:hypothetical protein